MSFEYETEKREFVRVPIEMAVRYKYLSRALDLGDDTVYEGTTRNLSGAGLLLIGKLPKPEWITPLLMEKIVVGINLLLPSAEEPIKALTRVAWIEAIQEGQDRVAFGLKFKEITKQSQDDIFRYVIRSQMK
jgi:c-di-GMP-binding flagellar brake protein YcgR